MTTIDNLQIEIQSNSTNASQGIHALAKSLGELKTNGTINVAIKNLNNLRNALKLYNGVPSNASKITALASSMERLKSVGPVGSVGNSLTKLATALKGLDKVNMGSVGPQIQRIAEAAGPLSSLKAGGLSTMVNALSKIGKVTADLDDGKIAAFADRIQRLNTVLEPLSTKMTTIQTGLRGINSSARSAGSSVKQMGEDINASAVNMSSFIYIIQEAVQWIQAAVEKFSQFIAEAIEWDGIAARFGRGFGSEAQTVYDWIVRLNEEMGINIQQFMQYSSIYATMLTGFGVNAEDSAKMALGYTELTYDIWAGYNDVYKTFEEASEAVKSAIAGEVEPIRRAGFTIIESTLEQTAANHGLEISLANATEAEKSYLRYLTLVDQAHAQSLVGTYAKELNTAEGLMRTFSQQLKSLSQAFGSLFLPALTAVMPYLQAFVEMLTSAVRWIASLFGIEIQGVDWSGYNAGVGEAAQNTENLGTAADGLGSSLGGAAAAAKELKNATLGIDELNVISPPAASGGAGGGGGGGAGTGGGSAFDDLDIDSLWDESIFDNIQSQVDDIKARFEAWLPVLGTIAGALAGLGLTSLIVSIGEALAEMSVLQKAMASIAILTIEAALVFAFADNYLESGNLLYLVGEALVTATSGYLMFKAWGPAGAALALGVSIAAQLLALEMSLADGTVSLSSPETWIQGISTILTGALGGLILSKHTGFFAKEGFVIGMAASASLVLSTIRMGAIESGEIESGSLEAWILEIGSVLTAGLTGKWLGAALYTGGGPMGALIGVTAGLILNLIGTVSIKGENFGDEISDWINAGLTAAVTGFTAVKLWGIIGPTVKTALAGITPYIATGVTTALSGLGTAIAAIGGGWVAAAIAAIVGLLALAIVDYDFSDIGYKLGKAIGNILRNIGEFFGDVGKFAVDVGKAILGGIESAIDWVADTFDIKNVFDVIDLIFNPVSWVTRLWPKMIDVGKEVLPGLWQGIKDVASNFWGNITEFIDGFIQGFKDGLGIASPSTVFAEIGKWLIEGLWNGISGMFTTIVTNASQWVDNLVTKVKEFFGIGTSEPKFKTIGGELVQGIIDGIQGKATSLWNSLKGWADGIVQNVKNFFDIHSPSKKFADIGGFIADGLVEGIKGKASDTWDALSDWAGGIVDKAKGLFNIDLPSLEFDVSPKNDAAQWWSDVKSWWSKKVGSVSNFKTGVSNSSKDWWANAKKWWGEKVGSVSNFKTNVSNSSKTWWSNVKKYWNEKVGSVSNFKTNVSNSSKTWWSNVKKWWSQKAGTAASFKVNVQNNASTWWSNVKSWWKKKAGSLSTKLNVQVPTIKVNWDKASAFGKEFKYPTGFSLKFAADGGIFDAGSLIWAGERGPEVLANAAGGKTGVMNVNQMQDAVFEGVYAAVMAANRAANGESAPAFNIYLDGKQITATVEKRQRERGTSIMGNQVHSFA